MEMTENNVIKALECCAKPVEEAQSCEGCSLLEFSPDYNECQTELMKQALDLIKRKNAEIERLKEELYKLRVTYNCELNYRKELHKRAKAEAYREFAERLLDKGTSPELDVVSISILTTSKRL